MLKSQDFVEFNVGDYKKLKVESFQEKVVSDKEVDDFLEELVSKQAEMEDFESDVETAKGHWVSLLVKGKVDGEDSKFLRHYNTGVTLGKNELYPKFDKELLGKKFLDWDPNIKFDRYRKSILKTKGIIENDYLSKSKKHRNKRFNWKSIYRYEKT